MTNDQNGVGLFTVLIAIAVLVIIFIGVRAFRKSLKKSLTDDPHLRLPVEIARIVEQNVSSLPAGCAGIFLIIFSAVSMFKYFTAETVNQQMVALLLWIGNGVFWGVFLIGFSISPARESIVYRDPTPADAREPRI